MENTRRNDDHLKADIATQGFSELLSRMRSPADNLALLVQGWRFEFDGLPRLE
jgi:hypothetical protein